MANKYTTKTCEECTAEFDISILNEDELNRSDIRFCPCCGKKMELSIAEDDEEFDGGFSEWDDQDNNSF
jgi:PHP family Zn ribbon phosphoesterase